MHVDMKGLHTNKQILLEATCVTVQRLGNMKHLAHVKASPTEWEVRMVDHKTEAFIGPGHFRVNIAETTSQFKKFVKNLNFGYRPFSRTAQEQLRQWLRTRSIRSHALRPGAIKTLYESGMPVAKIRRLTLHTSDIALLQYIDVK
jgi:hypothetical protein